MNRVVFLDSAPLGLLTGTPGKSEVDECIVWLESLVRAGVSVVVPEIIDYELRRELVRIRSAGVGRLSRLNARLLYLPLTTRAMLRAADLWATARQRGQPTAADDTIDIDVILAAQAQLFPTSNGVIATTNVGHLSRFYPAERWSAITP